MKINRLDKFSVMFMLFTITLDMLLNVVKNLNESPLLAVLNLIAAVYVMMLISMVYDYLPINEE